LTGRPAIGRSNSPRLLGLPNLSTWKSFLCRVTTACQVGLGVE